MHHSLSEDDIAALTRRFYAMVRKDDMLGPIFNARIGTDDDSWAPHIDHINDFWSKIFLRTNRFMGNPMIKHATLPGLTPDHFERWLELFAEAGKTTLSPYKQDLFNQMANRISQSLQMGLAVTYPANESAENPFIEFGLARPSKKGTSANP